MFDPTSRYSDARVGTAIYELRGRQVRYKLRRRLPHFSAVAADSETIVQTKDRLDLIAARTLGNSEMFWQICDANTAMNPFDLATRPGDRLRIPNPEV
jgi:hypothetical protein